MIRQTTNTPKDYYFKESERHDALDEGRRYSCTPAAPGRLPSIRRVFCLRRQSLQSKSSVSKAKQHAGSTRTSTIARPRECSESYGCSGHGRKPIHVMVPSGNLIEGNRTAAVLNPCKVARSWICIGVSVLVYAQELVCGDQASAVAGVSSWLYCNAEDAKP